MTWYFNFCSPHLTDNTAINIYRIIMVSQLLIAVIITFVLHLMAEIYTKHFSTTSQTQRQIDDSASQDKNDDDLVFSIANTKNKDFQNSAASFHKNILDDKSDDFSVVKQKVKDNKKQQGFFKNKSFFLTVQMVQNKAPSFLGHFTITLGACIMYSPFLFQMIMGALYLVAIICAIIANAWKFNKILYTCVGLSYCLNLALMTSAIIGLGLANWDQFNISCYYTQLQI